MRRWSRQLIIGFSAALGLAGVAVSADDPVMNSTSYGVVESQIGGTGDFGSASSNFKFGLGVDDGGSTLGDTFAGNSASTNYQTNGGFTTTAQPFLGMTVNSSFIDLGTLTTATATTATATFNVSNYTSYGYVVSAIGTTLTNGSRQITALATDTASSAGSKQFGFNLVANTSPVTLGADPVQMPDTTFSYGRAGTGAATPYAIANQYRFVSGETVASAPKSSGQTNYTMSFLANIDTNTAAGKYVSSITLVATGTY